ncbi:DNA methyltransferase protein [Streptococcus anginosus]|uniref:MGMT family protein n=2 Tax=Streptococcus anginosus TaxID=1328 RepID=A0AAP6BP23_STRAP|nr:MULTISPECIES: MGMT family protein [Streptococcus]MCW1035727.1 MGMT family protein [Streptococcus anginosus]MDU6599757.1 MGMT family protein [Streptococcus anginosus]MDX5039947.1 MGMT family protein [Streptococcus anginosus]OFR44558.1 cysteine methyltransferase [Streptococcus sp. HMSC071H03]OHR59607.1 cysteine methyltransferase [Streptococcus sp. HMSC034B03]
MNKVLNEKLINQILSVVACIPVGKVATYGQITHLIGRERNARLVGRVLSQAELYGKFPCHRVVNAAGRLAPAWEEQRHLLWAEGVTFKTNGCVDLKKHQWRPTDISKV